MVELAEAAAQTATTGCTHHLHAQIPKIPKNVECLASLAVSGAPHDDPLEGRPHDGIHGIVPQRSPRLAQPRILCSTCSCSSYDSKKSCMRQCRMRLRIDAASLEIEILEWDSFKDSNQSSGTWQGPRHGVPGGAAAWCA